MLIFAWPNAFVLCENPIVNYVVNKYSKPKIDTCETPCKIFLPALFARFPVQ